jgi:hypothetical protein
MNRIDQMKHLHHKAMRLADEASHRRRTGEEQKANACLQQALEQERRAADLEAGDLGLDPTRSVLDRSAAMLARQCGEYRKAERLITTALSGSQPEPIAEELRDLLLDVYFEQSPRKKRRPLSAPDRPTPPG